MIGKYQTKHGIRYRARFKFQGQGHRQAGFRTEQEAKDWITDKRRDLKNQLKNPAPDPAPSGTFADQTEAYLEDFENKGYQYNTTRQKHFVYQAFTDFLTLDPPIEQITRQHIKDYLKRQCKERGPKAANRDLRDLNSFFNWAMQEDIVVHNPSSHIEKYAEQKDRRYVPPPQDVAAVVLAASREERDLIEVYVNTAARMSEIYRLTKQDVDLTRKTIWVWTRKRKGGERKWRSIAMNNKVQAIIERRMKQSKSELVFENPRTGGQYHKNQHVIKRMLPRLCKKAEVKEFTMYAFRHYASVKAAIAYEKGEVTLRELQKLLGHERISTTEIYIESLETDTQRVTNILGQDEEENYG